MKLGKRFGIVAAMEELEETLAPVGAPPEIPDESESVTAGVAEINEDADTFEVNEEAIDDVSSAADELTDIADTVEKAGELDETSAAITEVAVESLYRRLGITRRKPMPVAMEAFGSTSNRKKATKLALEQWNLDIGKAFEAVKEWFFKTLEYIQNFIKSCFDQSLRIEGKVKKMEEALKKLGSRGEKTSMAPGKWAYNLISTGNGIDPVAALTNVKNELESALNGVKPISKQADIVNSLADPNFKPAAAETAASEIVIEALKASKFGPVSQNDGKNIPAAVQGKTEVFGSKLLPNGSRVIIEKSVDNSDAKISLVEILTPEIKGEVQILDSGVIENVLKEIKEVLAAVKNSKAEVEGLNKVVSAFKSKDSMIKKHFGEDKEKFKQLGVVVKKLRVAGKITSTPVVLLNKVSLNTCSAALNYCAASMKQYGGNASAPALPAPAAA